MVKSEQSNISDNFRQRLIGNQESEEDTVVNLSLRPSKMQEFVGQQDVLSNLKVAIQAAQARQETLEHLLLCGPPGLGKTSLAHIVANEMGTKITATSGPAIERAGDLIGILTNLGAGDVLFIDEVHRLSKVVEEFLYPAMENFQIDFLIDKGPYAKTIKFNLKHFTLVGATTRAGLLTAPLRSRFGMFYHFDFYNTKELMQILKRSAKILSFPLDQEASFEIAQRSRGTPRVTNRLLRRVRDYAQVKADGQVSREIAQRALEAQGVDKMGLDNIDRKVMQVIIDYYNGGPVGIESLAATLNEESDTIVDIVEPFLLKAGFLKRTPRGREVTETGYKHFNQPYKGQQEMFKS